MGEEERLGWACPRCPPIVWGGNWDDKKNHATTLDEYGGDIFSHKNKPKTCGHGCGCKGEDVRSGGSTGEGTNESFF